MSSVHTQYGPQERETAVIQQVDVASVSTCENAALPSRSLARLLFSGSSLLGVATLAERGLGFFANLAAARLGGAQVFGAYSLALTTATNVASYAGAGIGTTANRFSGDYPYGHAGYRGLLRALTWFSLGSASLAAAVLWFTAGPLASRLLGNPGLAQLLRIAALSAGAIILLECLRGLLIGQRRFVALLTLSVLFGGGLAIALPFAALRGPSVMAASQAGVAALAVALCVIGARKLHFAATGTAHESGGPGAGAIVRFGAMQLAGMVGLNAAGWWIASLVARSDVSLFQMGCYSVALQMRNICGMLPLLISQTAYAQLTDEGAQEYGGPGRVTLLSTVAATVLALLVCGSAAAIMPWVLPHLYGKGFAGGELAATMAVIVALVHMGAAPAAARLTVVSLPLTGVINGIWTVFMIGVGTWLVPSGGAAEATITLLGAHLLSAVLVLIALLRLRSAPRGLVAVSMFALVGSAALASLGWLRAVSNHKGEISVAMVVITCLLVWLSLQTARRAGAMDRNTTVVGLFSNALARFKSRRFD
jgi:O-antigen/teichoic acid export membrane protein